MPSNHPMGGTSWPGGTRAMGIHSMGRSSMMQKTASSRTLIKKSEDKRLVKRSVSYATNYTGLGSGSYKKIQGPSVDHTPNEDAARRDWHQRAVTHAHGHKHPLSDTMTHSSPNRRLTEARGLLNRYGGQHTHTHEHPDYSYGGVDFNDYDGDDGFQLSDYADSPANSPSGASPSASKTNASKGKQFNNSINSKNSSNGEEIDSYQSGAEGFRITKSASVVSLFEGVDPPEPINGGGEVCSQSKLIQFNSF
jgi:hypothetical protein